MWVRALSFFKSVMQWQQVHEANEGRERNKEMSEECVLQLRLFSVWKRHQSQEQWNDEQIPSISEPVGPVSTLISVLVRDCCLCRIRTDVNRE